ncbi:hypothetical protein [Kordia zhangzhouensis]|uniref:hypothetical protein n=1 Tax=Kordia zhangzhouensis TaxID=1620405 RepID=UPI000629A351|nr:hypothetical protein [Kordia zhangzhouensis]
MHRDLIISAFDKAKKDEKEETGVNMSVTGLSKRISDFMLEECHFQYHEKSLRNKLKAAQKDEPVELKAPVANCLCKYLDYENYADFVMKNSNQITQELHENERFIDSGFLKKKIKKEVSMGEKLKIVIQKNKVTLIFCLFVIIGFFSLVVINKQRWMVWENDRYVEVPFDVEKYGLSNLKLFKKDRVRYFRKVNPDCEYAFFKPDGSENLWYQKSASGELEFFTSFGLHPETGKTLKKITPHMIKKYICETY